MRKILALAALSAATIAAAAPASAQTWRMQPSVQRQIGNDINQLDRQITRAVQRRSLSQREATSLRREALQLQRAYNRFSRDGLDRQEVAQLEAGVDRVGQRLRLERRDWDGRRG